MSAASSNGPGDDAMSARWRPVRSGPAYRIQQLHKYQLRRASSLPRSRIQDSRRQSFRLFLYRPAMRTRAEIFRPQTPWTGFPNVTVIQMESTWLPPAAHHIMNYMWLLSASLRLSDSTSARQTAKSTWQRLKYPPCRLPDCGIPTRASAPVPGLPRLRADEPAGPLGTMDVTGCHTLAGGLPPRHWSWFCCLRARSNGDLLTPITLSNAALDPNPPQTGGLLGTKSLLLGSVDLDV